MSANYLMMRLMMALWASSGLVWALDDGSENAPTGTVQHPTLLSGYALRPPWKVAGVDYYVGIPSGTTLTDWKNLSGPGITVEASSGFVRVDGTSGVVFNGVDFSLHGGALLAFYNNSPNGVVKNCNFAVTSSLTSLYTVGVITADSSSPGLTVTDCTIDGGAPSTGSTTLNGSGLICVAGGGTIVVKYNWLKNSPSQVLDMGGSNCSLDYRFNMIENFGNHGHAGNHPNLLQWVESTDTSALCEFNTSYQTPGMAGEQYQFYTQLPNGAIINPTLEYNTIIATGTAGGQSTSYSIHGNNSTAPFTTGGLIENNYFDSSGAYGAFYSGSFNSGWTLSGNIDMVSGKYVNGDNSETALTPIQEWRLQVFGGDASNPAISGDTVAPAHDGIPNLIKYALGLDPYTPATLGSKLAVDVSTGYLRLTVQRNAAATDVTPIVQVSGDLSTWSSAGTTVLVNTPSELQTRDNAPVSGAQKRFIRLQVTDP